MAALRITGRTAAPLWLLNYNFYVARPLDFLLFGNHARNNVWRVSCPYTAVPPVAVLGALRVIHPHDLRSRLRVSSDDGRPLARQLSVGTKRHNDGLRLVPE
jgi:hypothetical protein